MKALMIVVPFFAVLVFAAAAYADSFGSGVHSFDIDFVTIGNTADTTGAPSPAGEVNYVYRIGMYEITEQMIDKANALRALGITKHSRGPDRVEGGRSKGISLKLRYGDF